MSIYNNPNFKFKTSSQEDYYDNLRKSLEERTFLNKKRINEDFLNNERDKQDKEADARSDYDFSINALNKKKALIKEDFQIGEKNLKRQLGQILKRTYARYVSKAPSMPTQLGLMSIEANANMVEKERLSLQRQRTYDKSVLGIKDRGEELQHTLDSALGRIQSAFDTNEQNRDRRLENENIQANTALLGYNRNEYSYYEGQGLNRAKSGVFGQNSLLSGGVPKMKDEWKFNNKISYGY